MRRYSLLCSFVSWSISGAEQITRFVKFILARKEMAAHERVLNALNFLTGEGVAYYPNGCDTQEGRTIEALITDWREELGPCGA